VRRPSAGQLSRLVADQESCTLTYAEHGATAAITPSGYHHDRWEAELGSSSQDRFDRLAESLWHWQVQLGAAMTVFPAGQERPGLIFALANRLPAAYMSATGRIVNVTSEPDCGGFAYRPRTRPSRAGRGSLPRCPRWLPDAVQSRRSRVSTRIRCVPFRSRSPPRGRHSSRLW